MDTLFQRIMGVRRAVVFRRKHLHYGWIEDVYDTKEPIYINLDFHGLESGTFTYLHEILHILYPLKSEQEIVELTDKVWFKLSARERFLLSKKLYNREWRTEL